MTVVFWIFGRVFGDVHPIENFTLEIVNVNLVLQNSGSEKGVFWKRGLFGKVHFLEILENFEILENTQSPRL